MIRVNNVILHWGIFIVCQVTLEEGEGSEECEGEGDGGMWRKLLGICKKLSEKMQVWWKLWQ